MRVHIDVDEGNGKGQCVMCNKAIKKGAFQVVATGYRQSGRAHFRCVLKEFEKKLRRRNNERIE